MTTHIATKKRKLLWMNNHSAETMSVDDISYLAEHGFTTCENNCATEANMRGYPCDCLLEAFPTRKYYELYKEARDFYLNELMRGALARTVEIIKGDSLNEK